MVWSKPRRGKKGEKNDVKRDRRVNKQSSSQPQRNHAAAMTPHLTHRRPAGGGRDRQRQRERDRDTHRDTLKFESFYYKIRDKIYIYIVTVLEIRITP